MQGNNQAMVRPHSQGSFLLVPMEGEIESILTPQAVNLQCPLPKMFGVERIPNRLTKFSRYSTGSYTFAMTVFHTLFFLDSYSQKRQISHVSTPPSNRLFVICQILGDTWPHPTRVSLSLSCSVGQLLESALTMLGVFINAESWEGIEWFMIILCYASRSWYSLHTFLFKWQLRKTAVEYNLQDTAVLPSDWLYC